MPPPAESAVLPLRAPISLGQALARLSFEAREYLLDLASSARSVRPGRSRALERASAPWRTLRQLKRLESKPRGASETYRFAVLGDAEPGRFWVFRRFFNVPGIFEAQLRQIQERGVDFSIQLGDMVSRGSESNYLSFFGSLARLRPSVPYLTVIGNHDRRFPHGICDAHMYRAAFGKTNYFFDRGPARFVAIDTSLMRVTSRQLAWLDAALDTPKLKLVFAHIPPAHLGPWTHYAGAKGVGGFRRGAAAFTQLLSRRGVDRVYFGHIHAFGVQDYEGVRYVLTGGGGSPLFPCGAQDRFHHYLVVTVGPEGVSETVHAADGGSVDIPRGTILLSK